MKSMWNSTRQLPPDSLRPGGRRRHDRMMYSSQEQLGSLGGVALPSIGGMLHEDCGITA
jgi:hypothetical protein